MTLLRLLPLYIGLTFICIDAGAYEPPGANGTWPTADARKTGWKTSRLDELEQAIEDDTFKRVTSILVAQSGELVFERYFGSGTLDNLNDMRSATKTITSLLVGAAIRDGAIPGVDVKVFDYFEDHFPVAHDDPRKREITLQDLLTMSSLLECNDDNPYSSGNEERMYVTEDWVQFVLNLPIKGYAPWDTKPSESEYGRSFAYCTAGTFLTGALVEKAVKMGLEDYARKVLHEPLGIKTVQWVRSPLGIHQGGGGTRYRSRDIAKIGELARLGGRWNGRQVLPEEWIHESTRAHVQAREATTYGYQWWRMSYDLEGETTWHWAMAGNGGNYVLVYPDKQLVTVITATAYNTNYMHPQAHRMYSEFILPAAPKPGG